MIHGNGMMTDGYRKSFGEILVEEGELVFKPTPPLSLIAPQPLNKNVKVTS